MDIIQHIGYVLDLFYNAMKRQDCLLALNKIFRYPEFLL